MGDRFSISMVTVAIATAAVSTAMWVPVTRTLAQAPAFSHTALKTPWGEPDLQAIWDFATITPMERPKEHAGKEVLTAEEAAELEKQAAQRRVDRPPRTGDTGSYNQFWFDSGTKVISTRRTSLVVDPLDGRIPPLTPESFLFVGRFC